MTALNLPALRRIGRDAMRPRPRTSPVRLVVVETPTPAAHALLWTVLGLLVLVLAVFGAVTFNAMAADDAVQARALELQLRDAEVRYSVLLAEVAALESPGRIAQAASDLGLVPADAPRMLWVERLLPADGAVDATARPGTTDTLKPLLARD